MEISNEQNQAIETYKFNGNFFFTSFENGSLSDYVET